MKPALDDPVERWQRVATLLEAALEREPVERARYLDEACAEQPALKAEVEALLVRALTPTFLDLSALVFATPLLEAGGIPPEGALRLPEPFQEVVRQVTRDATACPLSPDCADKDGDSPYVLERKLGASALFNLPTGAATFSMLLATIGPFAYQCAVMIRRSALEAIGGFQYVKDLGAVDYQTILAVSLRGPFEYVDRVVAYWRRHPGSSSWAGHQRDVRAMYEFVQSFMSDHATELALSADQLRQIERSWGNYQKRAAFNAGRYLLLQAKWAEARHEFLEALRSKSPSVFAGGCVGYAASLLRTNIEPLMMATGRVSFDNERAARTRR